MKEHYFVISDTHFGHEATVDFCGRPKDFEKRLVERNTDAVDETQVLVCLGDVAFKKEKEWHEKFLGAVGEGKKWLVRGNHDNRSDTWYLSRGWDVVAERLDIKRFGLRIAFSHRPLVVDGTFDINVHGHLHNQTRYAWEKEISKMYCYEHLLVCCEHTYEVQGLKTLLLNHKRCVIKDINQGIRYERAEGIHTYHTCSCGRNQTRRGMCWKCLEEEKERIEQWM